MEVSQMETESSEHSDKQNQNEKYSDPNKVPFDVLLKVHHKQCVWRLKFGKSKALNKTAEDEKENTLNEDGSKKKDNCQSEETRRVPLSLTDSAEIREIWMFMVYNEEALTNLRNPSLFGDCKHYTPYMRMLVLHWLMELCEVLQLRRITYYLSVDYFDRILSIRSDVPGRYLRLIGIVCLNIAAKFEECEIPKLSEFLILCNGVYRMEDALSCELLILNYLGWDLNILTPTDWLNFYMQIHFHGPIVKRHKFHMDVNRQFLFPKYSVYQFIRASQLIDMLSLDPGFLKFSYSTIAAAAMYFMFGKRTAFITSGITWEQLQPCAEYMATFYHTLRNSNDPKLQSCEAKIKNSLIEVYKKIKEKPHVLQTHVVDIKNFQESIVIRLQHMALRMQKTYTRNVDFMLVADDF